MATYQGAFEAKHVRAHISVMDVLASAVGYVLTIAFVGSLATFAVFAATWGVREALTWTW